MTEKCWYSNIMARYRTPRVVTYPITDVTTTSASGGGKVTDGGGLQVTERGVVYSTSRWSSTLTSHTHNGTGIGLFTSSLSSLLSNTKYYVRAYATNSKGTSYGAQVSFTTLASSTTTTTSSSTTTTTTTPVPTTTTTTTNIVPTTTTTTTNTPPTTTTTTTNGSGELLFHSGFEDNSAIIPTAFDEYFDFSGTDLSVSAPNSWTGAGLESGPEVTSARILIGNESLVDIPEIVADPKNASNKVLRFIGTYPNDSLDAGYWGRKSRMQTDLYSSLGGFSILYYKIKMLLPLDFEVMQNRTETIDWFTISEFWNESSGANMFRITLTVAKLNAGVSPLNFRLTTESYNGVSFDPIFTENNTSFDIPLDKWMELEINIIEGDNSTGRIYLTVTPEGESMQIIFNETTYTHHPSIAPNGITYFSPFKMYTYGYLADAFRDAGKVMQIYWDDFEIWSGKTVI